MLISKGKQLRRAGRRSPEVRRVRGFLVKVLSAQASPSTKGPLLLRGGATHYSDGEDRQLVTYLRGAPNK